MSKKQTSEYLTVQEAAEVCQLATKTIRRYIASGHLTAYRLGAHQIRIPRDELEAWLLSQRVTPTTVGR